MAMPLEKLDYSAEYKEIQPSLFRESEVLDTLLQTIFSVCDKQQEDLLWVSQNLLNIDAAERSQLDFIGNIVGQPRFLSDFNTEPYFGYDGSYQSKTFGSSTDPEVGGYWNSRSYFNTATSRKLNDDEYRRLIRARVIYNQSNCTANDLLEVINLITNSKNNTVQMLKHGLVQINSDDSTGILSYFVDRLLMMDNILPIAAGVRVGLESILRDSVADIYVGETYKVEYQEYFDATRHLVNFEFATVGGDWAIKDGETGEILADSTGYVVDSTDVVAESYGNSGDYQEYVRIKRTTLEKKTYEFFGDSQVVSLYTRSQGDYSEGATVTAEKSVNVIHYSSNINSYRFYLGLGDLILPPILPPNITSTKFMFEGCSLFNQNISTWDVSNVTDMSYMFHNAKIFNQDISNWNVSNVTDMSYTFWSADFFNQDISMWDTGNVTNMRAVFRYATAFNQDIGAWDTSKVVNMDNMFDGASTFNQDLSTWCVTNIEMKPMSFDSEAGSWILPKPAWGTCPATDIKPVILSVTTYEGYPLTEINFNGGSAMVDFGTGEGSTLYVDRAEYLYTIPDINYTITVTPTETIDLFSSNEMVMMSWGNKNGFRRFNFLHPAPIVPDVFPDWVKDASHMFEMCQGFNQDLSGWDVSNVTDMSYMFRESRSQSSDLSNWNVSNVTNMSHMFEQAGWFSGNLSSWDVSNVTDMSYMFSYGAAHEIGLSIGGWNTSKVTNMSYMFNQAHNFNVDLSSWDISSVTDTSYMFNECHNLFDVNSVGGAWSLQAWDTSSVTNMQYMFYHCYEGVPSNISRWNTSKVTNMSYMFNNCYKMGHVTFWDTGNVIDMSGMFEGCYQFNSDISNWNVSNVYNMDNMFNGCDNLVVSLDSWCVPNILSEPINMFTGVNYMPNSNKPVWGTCPRGENLVI